MLATNETEEENKQTNEQTNKQTNKQKEREQDKLKEQNMTNTKGTRQMRAAPPATVSLVHTHPLAINILVVPQRSQRAAGIIDNVCHLTPNKMSQHTLEPTPPKTFRTHARMYVHRMRQVLSRHVQLAKPIDTASTPVGENFGLPNRRPNSPADNGGGTAEQPSAA